MDRPRDTARRNRRGRVVLCTVVASVVLALLGGGLASAAWNSSGAGSAYGLAGALGAPSGVAVGTSSCTSTTSSSLPVSWSATANASGYSVSWAPDQATPPTTVTTTGTSTNLAIPGTGTQKTIYVQVTATKGNWLSTGSTIVSGTVGPCTPTCTAGSVSVNAAADTWIDQANTGTNHGSETSTYVQALNGSARRTLLRFSLPTLPTACAMDTATLRLTNSVPSSGRTIQTYMNTESWSEGSVTWGSRPASGGTAATSTTGSSAGTQQWTVTGLVQSQYSGSNYGFLLKDSNEGTSNTYTQRYSSRTGSNYPQLVIAYS